MRPLELVLLAATLTLLATACSRLTPLPSNLSHSSASAAASP